MKLLDYSLRVTSLMATFLLMFAATTFGQQNPPVRCATVYMDSVRHAQDPDLPTNQEFEEWINKEITHKKKLNETALIIDGVYQIPVVVHVIHDGDAIGTGDNLSAAVIQSQIDVLNEDFRKLFGTPGYNTHVVGADTKIEFCLAKRRPDGTAFPAGDDGINRVDRNTTPWGIGAPPYTTGEIDGTIKPWSTGTDLGGWNPADYMNFWVMDISGGILGYAQFPTTAVGGMGCGTQSTATDGVVMGTTTIGKSAVTGFPGPYNEGRTATHEIGHWLGLRHIWGDGGCGVDDFCADTPVSDGSNFGCATTNSCPDNYGAPWPVTDPNDMVENYMDYSDDDCMNIFTFDQMTRMRTVLENSPIRASLITSDACIPPAVSDVSIINILSPLGDNCPGSISPQVTLKNRGSSTLTSATIAYSINNGTPVTFNWTGSIASGATGNATLPASTPLLGINTIKAYTELPNGVTDPDPTFDTTTLQFAVSNGYQPDHLEDFESGQFPPDVRWLIDNANSDCMSWIGQSGVSSAGVDPNDAACAPFYNNNGSTQEEYLYTPIFILPCNAASAEVKFDHAYRRRVNASSDRLRLQMSLDCGATWTNTLFDEQGNTLSTGANSNTYWIPTVAGDWNANTIDLSSFVTASSQNIQFRFRATNAAGNQGGNIHVDNFEFNAVTPGEIEVDVAGTDVLDEGFYDYGTVGVGSTVTATFTINNPGTSNLTLTGPIVVTGNPEFTLNTTFGSTTVAPGGSTTFTVDFNPATSGIYSGSVSFGTNDCDEGTYNFILNGSTNVAPPAASFTATPTTLCEGGTVTYTDASSNATSWAWSFPNGTPNSATGAGPHVVTYATAGGPYDAQLDVTNAYGSDTDLQSALITVLAGATGTLPIVEGFEGGVAPTNWAIVNGGTGATWVQNTPGTAPTATNSVSIDNFNAPNPAGSEDDLIVEKFDLSGYISSTLTFDVAYARYNGTFFDQLDVLVSTDCGGSYTTVYSKSGATLATDPDQTGAYAANTWRNETVDLTPYIGSPSVEVIFRSISGYGQFLYLDNVNLSGVVSACNDPDVPTVTYTPSTVCDGQTATLTIAGNLNDATDWNVYSGSCGGTLVGTTNTGTIVVTPTGPSTMYYVRGEGSCVIPASCGDVNVVVTPIEDATFSFGAASYCSDATDPTPTATVSGGTYTSAPAGLSINGTTGEIDLSGSTPNTYTITYTTPGTCSASSDVNVTINTLPSAPSILASGSTTFCAGGSVDLTSSQASGNVWSTSATTATINVTTGGPYTVTYTDGNGCSATSAATNITVNANPATPTISASGPTSFCTGGSVDLTSSYASGNVWSNTSTTQSINITSTGNFSVTHTDGNGCSATSAITAVTVNSNPPLPTISAGGPTTFCAGGSVNLTSSQASGNVWSNAATSQTINATTSGPYSVTYTDGNGCSSTSTVTNITVNANPTAPTISASGPTTFCAGGSVTLTSSQASGNVWSNASTSNNIVVTAGGPYSVTYTDGNGCSATSAVTNVTVNPAPTIAIGTTLDPSSCATATGSIQVTGSGTGVVSWTGTATGNSGSVSFPYTITGLAAGSYNITFDNGCPSNTLNQSLTDPTPPVTPTITVGGPTTFCDGGSVTLTSSYGTGNTWSNAATTASINVTMTGTYSVTYTDGSGCSSSSAPVLITVNANPTTPTVSASGPTTFCSGGSVDLSSSYGTGNVWSNAASTQTINVTTAGPYSVTYTDGNGCSATSAVTNITVNATPATPTISASGPTTICAGSSVDLTSSQATGNVWSTAETTQTITASSTGSYTVTYTAGNGCSATSAATAVTVNPNPVIAIGGATDPATCGSSTGSITITGLGTGIVTWTGTASGNSGTISLPYTITGLTAGGYSVSFDQSGCTSNVLSPTLNDPSAPTAPSVVPSGATTFCAGDSVTLTSSYVSGNVWSNTATTQSITVNATGVYSVTYTDGSGCSSTSMPISVTVNPSPAAPVVTPSGATTFCDGGSVDLTSDVATGLVWTTSETAQTITVNATGVYDVTYTDGNGCTATSAAVSITVNPIPATPIITAGGATTFCEGGSVDLMSDQGSGNVWSTTETTQSISVSTTGVYDVIYTDGNGCTSAVSAPVSVTVNALPTVALTAFTDVCDHVTAFSLSGGSPAGGTYSGTGVSAGSFDPTVAGIGTHTISYDYVDSNGCSNTATADITVDDCTDISEITDGDIAVYPNPASNLVFVSVEGTMIDRIKVYDGAGRLVAEYTDNAEKIAIDISEYARGVYNLEIVLGNKVHRSRVIKQ